MKVIQNGQTNYLEYIRSLEKKEFTVKVSDQDQVVFKIDQGKVQAVFNHNLLTLSKEMSLIHDVETLEKFLAHHFFKLSSDQTNLTAHGRLLGGCKTFNPSEPSKTKGCYVHQALMDSNQGNCTARSSGLRGNFHENGSCGARASYFEVTVTQNNCIARGSEGELSAVMTNCVARVSNLEVTGANNNCALRASGVDGTGGINVCGARASAVELTGAASTCAARASFIDMTGGANACGARASILEITGGNNTCGKRADMASATVGVSACGAKASVAEAALISVCGLKATAFKAQLAGIEAGIGVGVCPANLCVKVGIPVLDGTSCTIS